MPRFTAHLPRRLFVILMLVGSALITAYSLPYFDFRELPPFAVERLPERFPGVWLASLRVHVAAALVSLPLCVLLTTRALQRKIEWHRWLGRLSGVVVLFALVPSGAILSLHAKGGPVVTMGFLLSAALTAWFLVRGVVAARRRDLVSHRRAMHHVVAQISVAVTSRAMLFAADAYGLDPDVSYVVALWIPVLASAAVAELTSRRRALLPFAPAFEERIRRALSPLGLRLRDRALARSVARHGR